MERIDYREGAQPPVLLAENGWKCLFPKIARGGVRLRLLYILGEGGRTEEIPAEGSSCYINKRINLAVVRFNGQEDAYDLQLPASSVIGAGTKQMQVQRLILLRNHRARS